MTDRSSVSKETRGRPDRAVPGPDPPPGLPKLAGYGALAFSVLLPMIELGRIGVNAPVQDFWIALVATVCYLPLQLRHVAYGLHSLRPAGAGWTLAAMALIMAAGGLLVGDEWAMMLASLVVSTLLIVRLRWSLVLVAAILIMAYLLGLASDGWPGRGAYFVCAVAIRGVFLFVVVWLVAAIRQLELARADLSREAVRRERSRMEADLSGRLENALNGIVAQAQQANRYAHDADRRLQATLRGLVTAARGILDDVRRILDSYRLTRPDGTGADRPPQYEAPVDAPVGQLLATVRRSRWLLFVVPVPLVGFLIAFGATGFGFSSSGRAEIAVPAGIAIGVLILWIARSAHTGRPRFGVVVCVGLAALSVGPWLLLGEQWTTSGEFLGAAVAMVVRGPARLVAIILPGVVLAAESLPGLVSAGNSVPYLIWATSYALVIGVMGSGALYGAVLLTRVVDALYETRFALATEAVTGERLRVSRDLHDLLGQSLSAISLKGDLAMRLVATDPAAAATETRGITELAVHLAHEVRRVTRDQRPVSLATEAAGAAELLQDAGIEVIIDLPTVALSAAIDTLLGWTIREGVTNVLRHSSATWCDIGLIRHDHDRVELRIVNDGAGQSGEELGHGISGLAARARTVDGSVTAERIGKDRFRLSVVIRQEALS